MLFSNTSLYTKRLTHQISVHIGMKQIKTTFFVQSFVKISEFQRKRLDAKKTNGSRVRRRARCAVFTKPAAPGAENGNPPVLFQSWSIGCRTLEPRRCRAYVHVCTEVCLFTRTLARGSHAPGYPNAMEHFPQQRKENLSGASGGSGATVLGGLWTHAESASEKSN